MSSLADIQAMKALKLAKQNTTSLADLTTNVKNFGADPTGVNDSTTAIQNAINFLTNGGTVLFPTGSYKITSQITTDPTKGSFVLKGLGSSKIIVATNSSVYGIKIGQSIYNTKLSTHNVSIEDLEIVASGNPLGGIYVAPGAFMPRIKNVKLSGFHNINGWAILTVNDGYNAPYYSWVDNPSYEDIILDDVANGVGFIGNTYRIVSATWVASTAYTVGQTVNANGNVYYCKVAGTSGSTAPTGTTGLITDGGITWAYYGVYGTPGASQTSSENTFSQVKLKNIWVRFTQTGGQAFRFEGSFARSVFDGLVSFADGNALTDIQTNGVNATSKHYYLKGTFVGATFQSLGAEGGGNVVFLDPLMNTDTFGGSSFLDSTGTWINTGWLNIPDSTKRLLKIIDPPMNQSHVFIDSVNSVTQYRRDRHLTEVSGILKFIGDTTQNSGYQTITVTLPTPMLEIYDIQSTISLDLVDTQANKALYATRVDSSGIDSVATVSKTNTIDSSTYLKYTSVTFFVKVNTNTSQGVKMRYSIKGRIPGKWDYYYGIS